MNTFCEAPFRSLMINPWSYSTCCFGYLDRPCKKFGLDIEDHLWKAWNCGEFQKLRRAILNNDYSFCRACPKAQLGRLTDKYNPEIYKPVMTTPPTRLAIAIDSTCNLYCISCRENPNRSVDAKQKEKSLTICKNILEKCLHKLELLAMGGSGEVFYSPVYLELLDWLENKYSDRLPQRLSVLTNGQLLIERWNRWPKLNKKITRLNISVDAACKETYEKVRRGASWEKLLLTLEYVRDFIKPKQPLIFGSFFTIHSENFREIPRFVELMEEYKCDYILLAELRRFGQTEEHFHERNVTSLNHPLYTEYLKVLEHPSIKNSKIIQRDLGKQLCLEIEQQKR